MALFGMISYVNIPKCKNSFSKKFYFLHFFLFIYHFLTEIASLKLNMRVCDAIPGTLYVVSEENAEINKNNRFTERFNFEHGFQSAFK